jgi:hypothetical protein
MAIVDNENPLTCLNQVPGKRGAGQPLANDQKIEVT